MRLTFYLTIFLVENFLYTTANEGKYTVIVPNIIYANDKYTAAVALHNSSKPCQIKVSISGSSYNDSKQVEVSPNEVKNLEFDVPGLKNGDSSYFLTAESVDCLQNFQNTTEIFYYEMNNYVSIQTDKGLYKSGDDINFRVLFMDKDLKPADPVKDAVIWFEDGKRNRIKEIKYFKIIKGVYTGKFRIPELTAKGQWTLGVKNGDSYDQKKYFVVDDIRSKYVIKVEATDSVSVKDGDMQVVVSANYISGKPLDGKVTIIIHPIDIASTLIKTVNVVNGEARIDFNIKDKFLPHITTTTEMTITAIVEDQLTGVKINASTRSFIYPYRYTMLCTRMIQESCLTFEAGKENDVLLQVIHINGSYVNDTKSILEFTYKEVLQRDKYYPGIVVGNTHPISENRIFTFEGHMNETGFFNIKVSMPELPDYEGYLHYYKLEYKYLDEQRDILYTYQHREDTSPKNYLHLTDQSISINELHLNRSHHFTVNSSQPLSYFIYNIIGHRNILKSVRVDLPHKPKVYNLALIPEPSWIPKFCLYIYYIDEKGEYHYAERTYHINDQLNPITVTAATHVQLGEELALRIQTTPNSFVGLKAVDERVSVLKNKKDFVPSQLESILDDYSTFTSPEGGYSIYPGKSSGCVTLTNANYLFNWKRLYRRPNLDFDKNGGIYRNDAIKRAPPLRTDNETASVFTTICDSSTTHSGTDHQVCNNFLETWIFADIENTETAEFTWHIKIPDTYTTWVLTAFSFNPSKGLGITEHEIKITTSHALT